MKRSLKVAGAGVALVAATALAAPYFYITGGRVKACGFDELFWCGSQKCDLSVDVTSCAPDGSGISVSKSTLHMCNPKKIVWTITDKRNYKFADDGIEFKDPNADFDGKVKNDHKFVWKNKHTHPANDDEPAVEWEYKVHILKIDDQACATLDPRVYNE